MAKIFAEITWRLRIRNTNLERPSISNTAFTESPSHWPKHQLICNSRKQLLGGFQCAVQHIPDINEMRPPPFSVTDRLTKQIGVVYNEGLVQERRNSSALAIELRLSCNNQSIYRWLKILCFPFRLRQCPVLNWEKLGYIVKMKEDFVTILWKQVNIFHVNLSIVFPVRQGSTPESWTTNDRNSAFLGPLPKCIHGIHWYAMLRRQSRHQHNSS